MLISFTIPGRLAGKGRPRFTTVGGFARAFTPSKTRDEEAKVARHARHAMDGAPPLEGPLALEIIIIQKPPPSWSKKKAQEANWITQKPDLDNICKLISDACNAIIFVDDSQIAKLNAERMWRTTGDERIEIRVSKLT